MMTVHPQLIHANPMCNLYSVTKSQQAIREVRAAKATIQAIADAPDLRAGFKDWQQER
jgi:hypothetical protein